MKKLLLIAALILLTTQIATAQDGPIKTGSPAEPTSITADPTYEEQVLEIVNQERWNHGQLPPLKGNHLLDNAAETHSTNMAVRNFFDHCDLDTGASPWNRIEDAGYHYWYAGENIAMGQLSPAEVMNAWMDSSGHRANILSTEFREIGVGYYYQSDDQANVRYDSNGDCQSDGTYSGTYYRYWTQNFGSRHSVYPVVINREQFESETQNVDLYMYGDNWATEMRFRNENGAWSSWQPYQSNVAWTLSSGNGTKTVNAEIRNGSGTVYAASDTIELNMAQPTLVVSSNGLAFALQHDGPLAQTLLLTIQNTGQSPMTWSLSGENSWLSASASNGTVDPHSSTTLNITASRSGQPPGVHTATLTIEAGNAENSPQTVNVMFLITAEPPVFLPMTTH
ncbi:MAG: hypothetical protein CSA11_05330 [Chloroflexi bacterium]|nr:MAG: hypothetical protein CSA11_05330 [Chloroflexota bacterium]